MNAKTIVVDGVEYVPRVVGGEALRLVIADNCGLTFVGYCNFGGPSEFVRIRSARCVIRWGTSQHLAELCAGPLAGTKLGAVRDVMVKRGGIIAYYDVAGDWGCE